MEETPADETGEAEPSVFERMRQPHRQGSISRPRADGLRDDKKRDVFSKSDKWLPAVPQPEKKSEGDLAVLSLWYC